MKLVDPYDREIWIPLTACKDGFLYYIHARNANAGIFSAATSGFVISRKKFGANYLFTEYHWDSGEPLGTVKPLREIAAAPLFHGDREKLAWLNERSSELPNPWIREEASENDGR
jgi:hypothetical protein